MFLGSLNLVSQSLLGQQAVARRVSVAVVKKKYVFLYWLSIMKKLRTGNRRTAAGSLR